MGLFITAALLLSQPPVSGHLKAHKDIATSTGVCPNEEHFRFNLMNIISAQKNQLEICEVDGPKSLSASQNFTQTLSKDDSDQKFREAREIYIENNNLFSQLTDAEHESLVKIFQNEIPDNFSNFAQLKMDYVKYLNETNTLSKELKYEFIKRITVDSKFLSYIKKQYEETNAHYHLEHYYYLLVEGLNDKDRFLLILEHGIDNDKFNRATSFFYSIFSIFNPSEIERLVTIFEKEIPGMDELRGFVKLKHFFSSFLYNQIEGVSDDNTTESSRLYHLISRITRQSAFEKKERQQIKDKLRNERIERINFANQQLSAGTVLKEVAPLVRESLLAIEQLENYNLHEFFGEMLTNGLFLLLEINPDLFFTFKSPNSNIIVTSAVDPISIIQNLISSASHFDCLETLKYILEKTKYEDSYFDLFVKPALISAATSETGHRILDYLITTYQITSMQLSSITGSLANYVIGGLLSSSLEYLPYLKSFYLSEKSLLELSINHLKNLEVLKNHGVN